MLRSGGMERMQQLMLLFFAGYVDMCINSYAHCGYEGQVTWMKEVYGTSVGGTFKSRLSHLPNCWKGLSLLLGETKLFWNHSWTNTSGRFLWLKVQFLPNHQTFLTSEIAVSHLRTVSKPLRTKAELSALPLHSNQHLLPGAHFPGEGHISFHMWLPLCGLPNLLSTGFFHVVAEYLQLSAYYSVLELPWKIRETWGS